MFDLGWAELLFVIVLALVVVGPKDLPHMLRLFGRGIGRLQRFYRETVFNLRRLENEIDTVSRKPNSEIELLPEHVRRQLAEEANPQTSGAASPSSKQSESEPSSSAF